MELGGSSRFLARSCENAEVTGVTLSPVQAARATALNREEGLHPRVQNVVANALHLPYAFRRKHLSHSQASDRHRLSRDRYADDSFDLAWSLESGEHIPEKEAWLAEVFRVLKPGGTFVCVTWYGFACPVLLPHVAPIQLHCSKISLSLHPGAIVKKVMTTVGCSLQRKCATLAEFRTTTIYQSGSPSLGMLMCAAKQGCRCRAPRTGLPPFFLSGRRCVFMAHDGSTRHTH